jgi:hypothetical protein
MKEIFTYIFKHNAWGGTESVSGTGSSLHESQELINKLPLVLSILEIRSILDAPCGDFNWMKHVQLPETIQYTGVDIVTELIGQNNKRFRQNHIEFMEMNIVKDELPEVDLIICRDGLVHFHFEDIQKAFQNFKNSDSEYILLTHFPTVTENISIETGNWRPLNFCLPPFSFPEPMLILTETLPIKTMALWKLSDIV